MTISSSEPIRVMLIDDHAMVRRGLATFLKVFDDLQLAGEAESGEAGIRLCGEVLPDVVLMDLVLPLMDGATATRAIRQKFPRVQVIALTSFNEGELVKNAKMSRRMNWHRPYALPTLGAPPSPRRLLRFSFRQLIKYRSLAST
jgi:CheY-like chemotaxis protein